MTGLLHSHLSWIKQCAIGPFNYSPVHPSDRKSSCDDCADIFQTPQKRRKPYSRQDWSPLLTLQGVFLLLVLSLKWLQGAFIKIENIASKSLQIALTRLYILLSNCRCPLSLTDLMVFDLTAKFIVDWTPWNSKCGLSTRCFIGTILKRCYSFIHCPAVSNGYITNQLISIQ
jgi:hypothetical protein